jgi:hypothetical protein
LLKDEYEKILKKLNNDYKNKEFLISEKTRIIEEKNKHIQTLVNRINELEKQLENNTAIKESMTKQLKYKLELQSATIANLTYQLHNLNKMKLDSESNSDLNYQNQRLSSSNSSADMNKLSFDAKSSRVGLSHNNKTSLTANNEMFKAEGSSSLNNQIYESNNIEKWIRRKPHLNSYNTRPPLITRLPLPPAFKKYSDSSPPPDPNLFLQASRSSFEAQEKNLNTQRHLITLPPIKPIEISQLAVESPHKAGTHRSSSAIINNEPSSPKNKKNLQ